LGNKIADLENQAYMDDSKDLNGASPNSDTRLTNLSAAEHKKLEDDMKKTIVYIARIMSLQGVPKTIVSDRGPQFVSRFWEEFHKSLGTKLIHSSAYHHQTSGQTKPAGKPKG
jgi:transposase InsO family protein